MALGRQDVHRFFHPETVALVGVSRSFGFGHSLPAFLARHGWADRVFPVNPNVREIGGLPAFPSVADIPGPVDLACILVPAEKVLDVFDACVGKGARAVVVMSAGFAETGARGLALQDALAERVRASGVRVMGPNCIGVVNVPHGFATCEILLEEIQPGRISIVAQSGVFGNVLLDAAGSQGLRIAKVATIGNRADLDETDFLEYLAEDPETGVVVLYLESLRRGGAFLEAARRTSLRKPVLAYLGGRTEAGRRATRSHTGALAGFGAVDTAALRQAGVWIARDPVDLLETARVFAESPLPAGERTLVVTASGSLGVMAADGLHAEGLELAQVPPAELEPLRQKSPAWMNLANPLDVGPSGLFREALDVGLRSTAVDAVIAFPIIPWAVVSPLMETQAEGVGGLFVDRAGLQDALRDRPVIVSPQGHPGWKEACTRFFGPEVPLVSTPQAAARALGALCRYAHWRRRREASHLRHPPSR